MNTSHNKPSRITLLAVSLSLAALSSSVWAGGHSHAGSFSGSAGRSISTMGQVSTANGMRNANRSIQGSEGRGAMHQSAAGYDPATQTFSHSAGTTTNGGSTASRSGSTTLNGDGTATHSSTVNGPNGNTASQQSTISYADGTASRNSTLTGPNGQTVTHQSSTTVTP